MILPNLISLPSRKYRSPIKEEQQVKKVGRELLEILKREKLVLNWRKRQQSRAQVRVTIEDIFDRGLPQAYSPELYQKKCDAVYQHVYDSYYGAGKSVYSFAV
jgi:type I restriction enzyme R subunit